MAEPGLSSARGTAEMGFLTQLPIASWLPGSLGVWAGVLSHSGVLASLDPLRVHDAKRGEGPSLEEGAWG